MFIKEPWFWRGAQSAAFYYISCAPCTKVTSQRKRRKESQRAKAEKAREMAEAGSANPYPDHPLPSGTNPYWKEEMSLGPGPPPKRRKKEDEGRLIEMQPGGSGVASSNGSKGTSSDTMDGECGGSDVQIEANDNEDGWNRRRYQREDEALWGLDETISHSTGISNISRTGSRGNHYYARNPAVNDLHPPVVSTAPTSRAETQWMLQPPPRAKIMEGKEKANRSRSASGDSHGSRGSSMKRVGEPGLGRQLSEKLVESKFRQSDQPLPVASSSTSLSRSRGSSNQSHASESLVSRPPAAAVPGQRHDRDHVRILPRSNEKDSQVTSSQNTGQRHPKALPPPISIESTRPPLSTIPSTSLVSKTENFDPDNIQQESSSFLSPHGGLGPESGLKPKTSDSSLTILQNKDPNPHLRSLDPEHSHRSASGDAFASGIAHYKDENDQHATEADPKLAELERKFASSGLDMPGNGLRNRIGTSQKTLNGQEISQLALRTKESDGLGANLDIDPPIGHRHRWSMDI